MNRSISHFTFILLLSTLFVSCTDTEKVQLVEDTIQETKAEFVPDSRVALFSATASAKQNTIVLTGETSLPEAKASLLATLDQKNIAYADSISVLPAAELGNEVYALVNNSVSNLRSEPKHSAQLATQAILGMPLKVLKKQGGWYLVQTPEDYLSWVDSGGITRVDKSTLADWADADKIIYLNTVGFSYSKANTGSEKVSDLVAGNILKLINSSGSYYEVEYPDGRSAFVAKREARLLDDWISSVSATPEALTSTAKTLIGSPYLWGGTSTKGMDCSGFTKTIYFMSGQIIPRDASQQVRAGELVDSDKEWDKLKVGDLLFFGREATDTRSRAVTHVGMWIGDNKFIHSASKVRISSVDPSSDDYDEFNTNRYLEARRYLDNWEGNIIQTANMYSDFLEN
jgi:cell wall-associated NlpC family hydrolase